MKFMYKFFKALMRFPLKVAIYAALVAVGAYLGTNFPYLYAQGSEILTRFTSSPDGNFDPQILLVPEKELNLIQSTKRKVAPRLRKVQILIRKQQAEIEYLREKARFIESRIPCNETEVRPAKQIISELAVQIENGDSVSAEQREFFDRIGGPAWIGLRNRCDAAETSLQQLLGLSERVEFLQARLEKRRLATLQYIPNHQRALESSDERKLVIPEIEEAKHLLEDVHETLFKTVYSLNPALVKETDTLVQYSSLSQ